MTEPEGKRDSKWFAVLAFVLVMLLGVAIAAQVRGTGSGDTLDSARPADLLAVLDNLNRREASLRQEIGTLEQTLDSLQRSGSGAALDEAKARLAALSIQVGTVGATGPGAVLTLEDPQNRVSPEILLDELQELRAAGAEAMQISGSSGEQLRIGVDTWLGGSPGAVIVDGHALAPAYTLLAIGDSPTLAAAVNIPGGVVDAVARNGGKLTVEQSPQVTISALRELKARQYSQPGK